MYYQNLEEVPWLLRLEKSEISQKLHKVFFKIIKNCDIKSWKYIHGQQKIFQ